MAAILKFNIFGKIAKTKNCILSPLPCETEQFCQNFQPPGYLRNIYDHFLNFAQNAKAQNSCYLLNRARWSDFIEIFDLQDIYIKFNCIFSPVSIELALGLAQFSCEIFENLR